MFRVRRVNVSIMVWGRQSLSKYKCWNASWLRFKSWEATRTIYTRVGSGKLGWICSTRDMEVNSKISTLNKSPYFDNMCRVLRVKAYQGRHEAKKHRPRTLRRRREAGVKFPVACSGLPGSKSAPVARFGPSPTVGTLHVTCRAGQVCPPHYFIRANPCVFSGMGCSSTSR